ncbi:hypothetical protein LshimejAT787_0501220 [Lyophyllum shimeji]|uniref:PH domain-containing protein n=1 Tax=Lyophyllum shimeji TaxID=47721 RepID=A0A9P3PL11_LYOSH|nr:hypothetical protein LshimejAT787_0501220 [Lyophyllum shimeji]
MSFPAPRSSAPGSLASFRFGSRSDSSQSLWKGKETTDSTSNARARRASTQSTPKGKEAAYDGGLDGQTSPSTTSFAFGSNETFASSRYKASHEPSRPSTADATSPKKNRGSLLVAASDALGFRFGRRRPSIRQPPMPIILPDVIEISAPPPRDEEDEERDRLRDMAAQSIGLRVVVKPDTYSLHDSVEEMDEESEPVTEEAEDAKVPAPLADAENHASCNIVPRSPQESTYSVAPTSPLITTRFRSRSMVHSRSNSRTNSISLAPYPQFPATFNAIDQFQQAGTMLYKYYQPPSLRIFALSKNWRHRFMVLSAPTASSAQNSGPPVSYLHLFKSAVGEEKELERLEINEDSVVFVAEEDVGGRKHVVKVGGKDVGAMKKELNHEEGGRTMWFLHITDSAEAQKWITVIKNAILGQRTVRAGLGLPTSTLGGVEPRGDMDVMLSMRAQGLITSPTTAVATRPPENGSQTPPDRTYASSISSHRSQATVARSVSSGAVSTLRGFFTGSTRPRSTSRATSIDSQHDRDRDTHEDSFGSMGNHLLGGLRPSTVDPTLGTHPVMTHASLPFSGSVLSPEHRLERKIAVDRAIQWASTSTIEHTAAKQDRATRTLSLGSLSLQPPPRKRWTSAGPARPGPDSVVHTNGDSAASPETASPEKAETEPPLSPTFSGFTFGTPEQRPRAPSIHSVSTLASAENNAEKSSSSTKRSSVKRWSRQGGVLPRRLTPPSGPPPSIPTNQPSASRAGRLSLDGSANRSRTSSTHSASSQKSFVSSLPSFSNKRASGSSVLSASSISHSPAASRPGSAHRMSMPPPRPAPTSALPPPPNQDPPKSDPFPSSSSSCKPSSRESVAHRAFKLSMIAPKPPPSGMPPPRPDEAQPKRKSHRRNSSAGSYSHPTSLDSIPASPVPAPVAITPPFPPPTGPLPPTPVSSQPATTNTTPTQSRPGSRHISIKQRLRILSAPSAASPPPAHLPSDQILNGTALHRRPLPGTTSTAQAPVPVPLSPPATPIAEKITLYQNDPSFLQIHTPVTPHLPLPRARPVPPESEVISLSPPPRRGSKQISVVGSDVDLESPAAEDGKSAVEGEHRLMSLSRPGSVISLGFVSM